MNFIVIISILLAFAEKKLIYMIRQTRAFLPEPVKTGPAVQLRIIMQVHPCHLNQGRIYPTHHHGISAALLSYEITARPPTHL